MVMLQAKHLETGIRGEVITVSADWAMVWITAVYVVATCFICWANIKSAAATKEQVVEMKRQYEEDKQQKYMPYLQIKSIHKPENVDAVELCELNTNGYGLRILETSIFLQIENIGSSIAKNIEYRWENTVHSTVRNRIVSLPVGDHRTGEIIVRIPGNSQIQYFDYAKLIFEYMDLLDNHYVQELTLGFGVAPEVITFRNYYISTPRKQ